jgi:2-oxoglutarate/2-oxoacid ferredoxin oxidoreductase subunit beta
VREHNEAVNYLDVITGRDEITVDYAPGTVELVTQHNGSLLRLRKLAGDYDIRNRTQALGYLQTHHDAGEIVTGLLYVDPEPDDLHSHLKTAKAPLNSFNDADLCPGSAALETLNARLR